MSRARLSGFDSSFLTVESASAHMHVGWVALFSAPPEGRPPSFAELRDHIERRLARAPRYRQKLAPVPFGLRAPEWVDDRSFSIDRHVYWAPGPLPGLVDEAMSVPLRRDRPLWELWVCDGYEDGQFAIVGKLHHCMVDGLAAVELGSLLLDPTPEPAPYEPDGWCAAPEPSSESLLLRGVGELVTQPLSLLSWSMHGLTSPARAVKQTATGSMRVARALGRSLNAAPDSTLNPPLSPRRSLAWCERPLDDMRTIRRAFGTTINDVLLAAVAGAMRAYQLDRGEEPAALKTMVPVDVRDPGDGLGNHLALVFATLPCDDPDPLGRLYRVHLSMSQRKRNGEPEGAKLALRAAEHSPRIVQQAISRVVASPHTFNLVVSNIPGPAEPLFMLGCPLEAAYPVVPLADRHAVSVGMTTVHGQACFGIYADREALPDVGALAREIDGAISELLAEAQARPPRSAETRDKRFWKDGRRADRLQGRH